MQGKDEDDPYELHNVPGGGSRLADNTYWNFISATEADGIRTRAMASVDGRQCLEIKPSGDKILAHWAG